MAGSQPRRWLVLLILVGVVAATGCGTPGPSATLVAADTKVARVAPSPAPLPALPAPCQPLESGDQPGPSVPQGLDGRLHGCFRASRIPAGDHRVGIVAYAPSPRRTGGGPLPLRVTPAHAHAGDTLHLTGVLHGAGHRRDHADVCWSRCDGTGLEIDALEVHWAPSPADRFDIALPVPATAWLGSDGPHALRPGEVTITVTCLDYDEPCAAFAGHALLEGPTPDQCVDAAHPCAGIELSARVARTGDTLVLDGSAPLPAIIGQPTGYALEVDPPQGPAATPKGGIRIFTLATASLRVEPAPALAMSVPAGVQRDSGDPVAIDAADPRRVAFCEPGVIDVTDDAGRTWTTVPIGAALRDAAASDVDVAGPWGEPAPPCDEVTLDPAHRASYLAAFLAVPRGGSPPPFVRVGYVSVDTGRHWQRVPSPAGTGAGDFGGFRVVGSILEAFFFAHASDGRAPLPVRVEESRDGGRSWALAPLHCPGPGPGGCAVFTGVVEARGCAGPLGTPQLLETVDARGGRSRVDGTAGTWGYPGTVQTCDLAELVRLRDGRIVLLGGSWDFPVQVSEDAGRTWRVRSLPDLPHRGDDPWSAGGLQVLPDGSLLQWDTRWEMLRPRADAWCSIPDGVLPAYMQFGQKLVVDGSRVWWTEGVETQGSVEHWRARSTQLTAVRCA